MCVCGKNTYFSVGGYSLNSLISKLFQRRKKESLLSSTQYELVWSHACFRPVKCHHHECFINYNYFLDLFVFSGAFGKLQKACIKFVLYANYHKTNKCTNCMSFIFNSLFKTLFTAPTCFDSISLIIIREHI